MWVSPRRGQALVSSGAGVGEDGEGVVVGPLILAPFLLEHSFSDSGFRPGGDGPPSPPGLGVGIGNFFEVLGSSRT